MINITCEDEFGFDIFTFYLIVGAKVQLTSSPFYKTLSINIDKPGGN